MKGNCNNRTNWKLKIARILIKSLAQERTSYKVKEALEDRNIVRNIKQKSSLWLLSQRLHHKTPRV